MSPDMELVTDSPEETQRVARLLGERCRGDEVFFLAGPLGSGKTCFIQGLAWGLGIEEYTHSPTFVMVTEYHGRLALYHIDLYRVESIEEALDLGLEEYLSRGGVCAIEWAEKALPALERQGLLIELAHVASQRRLLTLRPWGERYEGLLLALEEALARRVG